MLRDIIHVDATSEALPTVDARVYVGREVVDEVFIVDTGSDCSVLGTTATARMIDPPVPTGRARRIAGSLGGSATLDAYEDVELVFYAQVVEGIPDDPRPTGAEAWVSIGGCNLFVKEGQGLKHSILGMDVLRQAKGQVFLPFGGPPSHGDGWDRLEPFLRFGRPTARGIFQ